ncbi:uncharacterized protein BX664DRAFT_329222 [Halteromyces radiatus]|uniref:uncharacterized protein n=1 Tax=Halteromyces radiatus TaxID=101107 RepID=UPI00221E74F2|nr:uncharacterized protein BX664DRAFT_329222 [Halteromyces radiatus]KAI8093225.1 hypothetical protein BX664DRAFT_329222 [Halteromyces radiatus]
MALFNLKSQIYLPNRYQNAVAALKVALGQRVMVLNIWNGRYNREARLGELLYYLKKYNIVVCYRKDNHVYLGEDLLEKVEIEEYVPFSGGKKKKKLIDKTYIVLTDNNPWSLKEEYHGVFIFLDFIHLNDEVEINKEKVEEFLYHSEDKPVTVSYNDHDFDDHDYKWEDNLDPKAAVNALLNIKNYVKDKGLDTTQVDNIIPYYQEQDPKWVSPMKLASRLSSLISYYELSINVLIQDGQYLLKTGYNQGSDKFCIRLSSSDTITGGRNYPIRDSSAPFNW